MPRMKYLCNWLPPPFSSCLTIYFHNRLPPGSPNCSADLSGSAPVIGETTLVVPAVLCVFLSPGLFLTAFCAGGWRILALTCNKKFTNFFNKNKETMSNNPLEEPWSKLLECRKPTWSKSVVRVPVQHTAHP